MRFSVQTGAKSNPSRGDLTLPTKKPGFGLDHALSNLRFNWILGQLAQHEDVAGAFELAPGNDVVRAIEAALFMIGKRVDTIERAAWPEGGGPDILDVA